MLRTHHYRNAPFQSSLLRFQTVVTPYGQHVFGSSGMAVVDFVPSHHGLAFRADVLTHLAGEIVLYLAGFLHAFFLVESLTLRTFFPNGGRNLVASQVNVWRREYLDEGIHYFLCETDGLRIADAKHVLVTAFPLVDGEFFRIGFEGTSLAGELRHGCQQGGAVSRQVDFRNDFNTERLGISYQFLQVVRGVVLA